MNDPKQNLDRNHAVQFIVSLGFVSLLADMTYQGARGIIGPYLAILGASGAVVGVVAGFGEMIGYVLRIVSGFFTDRSKKYWAITLVGYGLNLIAIPLLSLAGRWEIAVGLILIERIGKAIRTPARDAMISYAAKQIGQGWGFGLHKALDQIGGMLGPLVVAGVLAWKGNYSIAFAVLFIPALAALFLLIRAKFAYPNPHDFEPIAKKIEGSGLSKSYWIYLAAASLVAAGYADFPLIAFHLKKTGALADVWVPVSYTAAMFMAGVSALVFGRLFDRVGLKAAILTTLGAAFFAPLAFSGQVHLVVLGILLWGLGMGAQESVMRAAVAVFASAEKRASAYGIFNTSFGVAWFLGSALMGFLYDISIPALVAFSVLAQLAAIPFLILIRKNTAK